jgi:hypothetical protein
MAALDFMVVPELQDLHAAPRSQPLLWDSLESMLHGPAEVDAVRTIIGEELLGSIHVASVELLSLIEILAELRDRKSAERRRTVESREKAAVAPSPTAACSLSNGHKELLHERLRLLLERTRVPVEEVLKTQRELHVVEFVSRPASRARSVASSATKSTDSRPTSAASSSTSQCFVDPNALLQPIRTNLHFNTIHRVAPELRELFCRELDLILGDISVIRQSLEEEMFAKQEALPSLPTSPLNIADPTETEIRDVTRKLEDAEHQVRHIEMIQRLPAAAKRASLKPLC